MNCLRCGIEDANGQIAKRVERHTTQLCSSCRARPAEMVDSDLGKCLPHKGDFDLNTNTPLDADGKTVMPGYRICKNADCVEPDHVLPLIELERVSIVYRTGVVLNPADQMKSLLGELVKRRMGNR